MCMELHVPVYNIKIPWTLDNIVNCITYIYLYGMSMLCWNNNIMAIGYKKNLEFCWNNWIISGTN